MTQQAKVSNSSDQVSPKENSYNENKKCHRRACPNCASTKNTFEATAVIVEKKILLLRRTVVYFIVGTRTWNQRVKLLKNDLEFDT